MRTRRYALHVLLVEHGKVYKNGVGELKRMASAVAGEASADAATTEECLRAAAKEEAEARHAAAPAVKEEGVKEEGVKLE